MKKNSEIITEALNNRIMSVIKDFIIREVILLIVVMSMIGICKITFDKLTETFEYVLFGIGITCVIFIPILEVIKISKYYAVGKILESEGIISEKGFKPEVLDIDYKPIEPIYENEKKISVFPLVRDTLLYAIFTIILIGIAILNIDIIGISTAIFIVCGISITGTGIVVLNLSDIKRLVDDK